MSKPASPLLAETRRANLAKGRAALAERRAADVAKATDHQEAVDALFPAILTMITAVTTLTQAVQAMVEANTPKPFVGMGPTFNAYHPELGKAPAATRGAPPSAVDIASFKQTEEIPQVHPQGKGFRSDPDARFAAEVATPEFQEAMARWEADPVPRRTASPAEALADMAQELAEMAAEDDELPPPPDEGEVWSRRLATFREARMWMPSWGPRPGQPGCLVPEDMMVG